jgi:serine/threonine-protein kinase
LDAASGSAPRVVGRYALYGAIAAGGMATVHLGRLVGDAGFSRPVAIKRLHPQFARDPDFAAMFLDEAHLAARVRHANVVQMVDVVAEDGEIFLVMEYVHGESFAYLLRAVRARRARLPARVVCNIVAGALQGLHAAHTAVGEGDRPLCIVHRDVSPQNVLVGIDGIARVLDFGVAKAVGKLHVTREGQIKGKLRYMAPEQVHGEQVTPRTDLWAASVMLWEALTGQPLFGGDNDAAVLHEVLVKDIASPRDIVPELPEALAEVVLSGLQREPENRCASAREMAAQLENAVGLVPAREVGDWVQAAARAPLAEREKHMADLETVAVGPTIIPVQTSVVQARPATWASHRASLAMLAVAAGAGAIFWLARRPSTNGRDVGEAASSGAASSPAPREVAPLLTARVEEPQHDTPPSATASAAVPVASSTAAAPTASAAVEGARPPEAAKRVPRSAPPSAKEPAPFKVPLYGRD